MEPVSKAAAPRNYTSEEIAALAWEQITGQAWAALNPAEQRGLLDAATIAVEQNTDWGGNAFLVAVLAIATEQQ